MESGSAGASAVTTAGVAVGAGSPIDFGAPPSLHDATDTTLSTIHFALDSLSAMDKTLVWIVSILASFAAATFVGLRARRLSYGSPGMAPKPGGGVRGPRAFSKAEASSRSC